MRDVGHGAPASIESLASFSHEHSMQPILNASHMTYLKHAQHDTQALPA